MSDLGWLTSSELAAVLPEFLSFYQDYQVDDEVLFKLQNYPHPVNITVILGTWCPDCYREVSRFIRLMELVNLSHFQVSYLGVDRHKQDPQGFAQHYQFTRIPTFILERDQVEIGRIVEQPENSLAEDLLAILESVTA